MNRYRVEIRNISVEFAGAPARGTVETKIVEAPDRGIAVKRAVDLFFKGNYGMSTQHKHADGSANYQLTSRTDSQICTVYGNFYAYAEANK